MGRVLKINVRSFLKQSCLPLVLMLGMIGLSMIFKETLGWLSWLALTLLYLLATTPVSNMLVKGLEQNAVVDLSACKKADAIVVLGAGRPRSSPELEGFQPTALSLERIRYTAILHKQCGVPILATGGGERAESETMARVLKDDYGVDTKWIENQSLTTWQNALYSRALLNQALGDTIHKVVIVTHAWHMPRSVLSFKRAGFDVIPAPTAFNWREVPWKKLSYWLPRIRNLQISETALHEYMGLVWYWLTSR